MVAAPLRYGHRSVLGGERRRQYSQAYDAAVIQRAIERDRRCLSVSDSP
jgi:hypothetical protein